MLDRRRRTTAPARAACPRSRTAPSPPRAPSPTPSRGPSRCARRPCRVPRSGGAGGSDDGLGGLLVLLGSSSPKRSSWIQSARPETPTPRRRTPPEVSRSVSRPRARRAIVGPLSVGEGRVVERLRVVKSCSRTLIVTVRPERPLLRSRSATLAGLAGEQPLHQLAVGQVGVVGALDADRLGLPLRDDRRGRRRRGPARTGRRRAPCPISRTSSSRLTRSSSATVWMPARRSRSAVAGPTPGMTVTCIGRSRSCSVPGATTTRPSGLSRSLATLAMNLELPMPTDAVSPPVASVHAGPQVLGERRDGRYLEVGEAGALEVDEGLVERQRLDQRGDLARGAPSPPALVDR